VENERTELVFVVRMWRQGGRDDDPMWRGSVNQVNVDGRFYVAGARDVADFIDARLAQTLLREPE
jgi:hypothetical protein